MKPVKTPRNLLESSACLERASARRVGARGLQEVHQWARGLQENHKWTCGIKDAAGVASVGRPGGFTRGQCRPGALTGRVFKQAVSAVVMLFTLATAPCVHAQTNIGLNIQMYAGLSVTGEVGKVYQVQYSTALSDTNTWYALQHFELKWNPHEFVDTTCPATERRFYRAVEVQVPTNVVPVADMVFIPSGTFMMGSPESEPARYSDETQHEVTLSRGLWMGKYEVTQAEYQAVMGSNSSYFQGANLPVETVSWHDAVAYCAALTVGEVAAGRLPAGYGYRLPTEAQWEYACRAGTTTPFHYGHALRSGMANFDGRYEYPPCGGSDRYCYNPTGVYLGRTTAVGSYAPNAWGLYDMHGNVWEWCADWYGAYDAGPVNDPVGSASGSYRVFRGGYWHYFASYCLSANRFRIYPEFRNIGLGFRVALVAVP